MTSTAPNTQAGPTIASVGQFLGALYPVTGLAVGAVSAFLLLRPYLPDVYEPKRERVRLMAGGKDEGGDKETDGNVPPELPLTVWRWVYLLWSFSEEDIIRFVGSDAYMFLRFLRMAFKVTLCMLVYGLGVLVPINMYGAPKGLGEFEQYSMSNVQEGSDFLWAHWLGAYLFSGLLMSALYQEYQTYVKLRQRYMKAPTVQSYSMVITDIPKDVSKDVVHKYLKNLVGEDALAVHMVESPDKYDALIDKKDAAVFKLEAAREKLSRTGVRPTHKKGVLGLCGERVDSIEDYQQQIADINGKIATLQQEGTTFQHAAIVTLESIRVATAFRSVPLQEYVRFLHVTPAPAPSDIIWANLGIPALFRGFRSLCVLGGVFFIIFCYIIPVGFVSSLANLRALANTRGLEFLQPVVDANPKFTSFLQGFVPPLVLSIFFSMVPYFMLLLSRMEGRLSESDCQRSAIEKVFAFVLFDNFLAVTFAGAVLTKIDMLEHLAGHPVEIINLLATTLPAQSTFFMNLIMISALNGLPMELLRVGPLFITKACRYLLADSKWAHLKIMTQDCQFNAMYAFPLLVLMAGVCYSVLAPVILIFVLIFFGLGYCVWLNQLLYVYNVPCHTGGSQFPSVFRCCMLVLVMFQLLVTGVLGLKGMATAGSTMAPLIALTFIFSSNLDSRFRHVGSVLTLENLLEVDLLPLQAQTVQQLKKAYVHRQDPGTTSGGEGEEEQLSVRVKQSLAEPYGVTNDGLLEELAQQQQDLMADLEKGKTKRASSKKGAGIFDEDEEESKDGRGGFTMMNCMNPPVMTELQRFQEEEGQLAAGMANIAAGAGGGKEEVKEEPDSISIHSSQ